jgi:DNA-binding LacI/PurR family transcriptional regulator
MLQEWIREGVFPPGSILPSERQLAAKMEVGLATVQRALHVLDAEGIISQHGHTRIVTRAKEASLLTNVVAVLTAPNTPQLPLHKNGQIGGKAGYLNYIATGALSAIQKHGLHAIALQPANLAGEQLERLLAQKPMGVIIPEIDRHASSDSSFSGLMEALVKSRVPFVVDGNHPDYQNYDRVFSDHESGGYQLTQWLLSHGRKRILCVLPTLAHFWAGARHKGYLRAMKEAGIEPLPLLDDDIFNVDFPDQAIELRVRSMYLAGRLLPYLKERQTIDAIMATNDRQAFEIRAACAVLGYTSDESLWVTGYDNFYEDIQEFMSGFHVPIPAATVDKRNFDQGEELLRLLLDRVRDALPPEPQERKIEPIFLPLRS